MYFKLLMKQYILYNITSTTELLNSVSIDNSFIFIFYFFFLNFALCWFSPRKLKLVRDGLCES